MGTKHYLYEKAAEYTDVLERLHDLMGRLHPELKQWKRI